VVTKKAHSKTIAAKFPAQGKEQGIFSREKKSFTETSMDTGDPQLLRELTGK